jgi:dynein heavy chain
VIYDLAIIEPTYQYSLEWYLGLFQDALAKSKDMKGGTRNANIIETTQLFLYDNTCRALLEKDKLIFSFLLCIKILEIDHIITMKETRFLMIGGSATEANLPQPEDSKSWMSSKQWYTINEFSELLPCFKNFNTDFEKHQEHWKRLYNSTNPHELDFPE